MSTCIFLYSLCLFCRTPLSPGNLIPHVLHVRDVGNAGDNRTDVLPVRTGKADIDPKGPLGFDVGEQLRRFHPIPAQNFEHMRKNGKFTGVANCEAAVMRVSGGNHGNPFAVQ